jgi:hypothetical protein
MYYYSSKKTEGKPKKKVGTLISGDVTSGRVTNVISSHSRSRDFRWRHFRSRDFRSSMRNGQILWILLKYDFVRTHILLIPIHG